MTDERRFEELWAELKRIGVDPYAFPAGITLSREEAIKVASTLADDAGPTAFLAAIRNSHHDLAAHDAPSAEPGHDSAAHEGESAA